MLRLIAGAVIVACLVDMSLGNGRLVDPPMRSSLWRMGYSTPINYNDHTLNCGGFERQHNHNGGKCGVCGDPWDGDRENEAPGKYATGVITRQYTPGSDVTMSVEMLAPRGGYFELRLCPVSDPSLPATQECLDQHPLEILNGEGTRYPVEGELHHHHGIYDLTVRLPAGVTCSQCVIQWKYHAGNEWGYDSDGRMCRGCGPQMEQYNCADVAISTETGSVGLVTGNEGTNVMSGEGWTKDGILTTSTHHPTTSIAQGGGGSNSPPEFSRDTFGRPGEIWDSGPGTNSGDMYSSPSPTPYSPDVSSTYSPGGGGVDIQNNPDNDGLPLDFMNPTLVPPFSNSQPSPTPYFSGSEGLPSDSSGPVNLGDLVPEGPAITSTPYGSPVSTTPEIPDDAKIMIPDPFFDDNLPPDSENPNQETVFNDPGAQGPTGYTSTTTPDIPDDAKIMIPDPFFDDHLPPDSENPNQETVFNDPGAQGPTGYTSTTTPDIPNDAPVIIPDPVFDDLLPTENPQQAEIPPPTNTPMYTSTVSEPSTVVSGEGDSSPSNNELPQDFSDTDPSLFTSTDNEHDISPIADNAESPSWSTSMWDSDDSGSDSTSGSVSGKKKKKSGSKSKKFLMSGGWGHGAGLSGLMNQLYHLSRSAFLSNQIWGGHGNVMGMGNLAGSAWGGNGGALGVGMWPTNSWGVLGANTGNMLGGVGQWGGNPWANSLNQNAWGSGNTLNTGSNSGWSGNSWGNGVNNWNGQSANSWNANQVSAQRPLASHLPRCESRQRLVCVGLGTFANSLQTKRYCNQDCGSGGTCPVNICSCRCAYQQSLDCQYQTTGIALPSNHQWCNNLCNSGSCPVQLCKCNPVVNW